MLQLLVQARLCQPKQGQIHHTCIQKQKQHKGLQQQQ
jgi:hypothetical protein